MPSWEVANQLEKESQDEQKADRKCHEWSTSSSVYSEELVFAQLAVVFSFVWLSGG